MYNITLCSSSHLVNASSWVSVGLIAIVLNRPLLQQNLHVVLKILTWNGQVKGVLGSDKMAKKDLAQDHRPTINLGI